MSKITCTMFIENAAGGGKTLVRGIPLKDALRIATGHDGAGEVVVVHRVGKSRCVMIPVRPSSTKMTRSASSNVPCSPTPASSGD